MGRLDRNPKLVREYHERLMGGQIPDFLLEYAQVPEMMRLRDVGCNCGMNHTSLYDMYGFYYDGWEHSLGVAIITWRFMRDRAAALAALFHDIAVPCFKHCVDYMLGDPEKQESTESRTEEIIRGSKEIRTLLARDGIPVEQVLDYKDYWAADNDLPRFSADRIDYTLNFGFMIGVWSLEDISEFCMDMTELVAEDGSLEIGFSSLSVAEKYIFGAVRLWPHWFSNRNRMAMQLVSEVVDRALEDGIFTLDELWSLPEMGIASRLYDCYALWQGFVHARDVIESNEKLSGSYVREKIGAKRRWTDPLVGDLGRVSHVSPLAHKLLAEFLAWKPKRWAKVVF